MVRLPEWLRHQLEASMIGLLLVLSSVIYVRDTIDGTTIQFMIFFFLGTVLYARRLAAQPELPATVGLKAAAGPRGRRER